MKKIYIKNMACESCLTVVKDELKNLNVAFVNVTYGEAELKQNLSVEKKQKFNNAIKKSGLEILENKQGILTEKIKILINELIEKPESWPKVKFSVYLKEKLGYDYNYMSNLFSETQATTIEQYIILKKAEKIKELILFSELSLTEISHKLKYNNVSHMSAQFKKATGLTPSHFKKLKKLRNLRLDS
ncbi:MAG: AraC family transcriptional regulator [Bacteroidota bacterium]|nr:AraC family transcriptional regulator [Bacteroidota bacterium]